MAGVTCGLAAVAGPFGAGSTGTAQPLHTTMSGGQGGGRGLGRKWRRLGGHNLPLLLGTSTLPTAHQATLPPSANNSIHFQVAAVV
ncbi:hypothetical protein PR048_007150 [Dryococelus australis]|uniref:Secreted protein n=1 Tax=Dryococelus australis TaxID=614101 RepID=A0ABQ9ICY7_9NEOP|nr:hypothetical protein PR048_007150 [Dryococelus australis]